MSEPKVKITAETAQAQAAIRTFGQELTGLTGKFGSLIGVAGTLGSALSVTAFAGIIKSSIDLQDELTNLSSAYNITAREAAGLKFAAEQNNTSLEAVAKATKALMVNMAESPDKFAKLGITAKDATGALAQVADVVAQMPEGQQKVALLAKLMGERLGPEMAEFLSQGGDSLRQYMERGKDIYKVTDDNAAKAKEFNDQVAELEARASGFGISIANKLLPGLTETADEMNRLAKEGDTVAALWRGLMGMGKVPWDLLMPPDNLKKELSSEELIKDLQAQIGQLERNKEAGDGKLMQWIFGTPKEIDAEIAMLRGRIEIIKKHAKELDTKPEEPQKKKTIPKSVQNLLAGSDKVVDKEGDYLMQMYEKDLKARADKKKKMDETIHENAVQSAIEAANRIVEAEEKAAERSNKAWENFSTNVQRNLGDVLYNGLNGKFDGIGELFKQMLFRMAADAAAANLTQKLFGKGGEERGLVGQLIASFTGTSKTGLAGMDQSAPIMASYAGGGYTGAGSRSGGLDGKGGFLAIMHPQETVVDHTKGQVGGGKITINDHSVIQVDSRSDRAQVLSDVSGLIDQKQAQWAERLRRDGAIA